jgi:Mg2+ and Co2+ transporter CorA
MMESSQETPGGFSQKISDDSYRTFPDVASFTATIRREFGVDEDLTSVLELTTDFSQVTSQYLLLNIKENHSDTPDNLLFLTEEKILVCSHNAPDPGMFQEFEDVLEKSFGKSTVITFLVINRILSNHIQYLETITKRTKSLEDNFNHDEYRALSFEFERFNDRLEEFHDLILVLQERRYKQIQTQYISFDYRVLIAESQSLQAKCRRRLSSLKDLRQDHEIKATEELNQKIMKLNDVLKKLTSITVILMLPTLIASHFGMNFYHMPELHIWWVYPLVIGAQIVIMGIFFIIFKKIDWL